MLTGTITVTCDCCQTTAAARLHGAFVELPRDWISTRPVFNTQNQTKHFCSAKCFADWNEVQRKPARTKVTD